MNRTTNTHSLGLLTEGIKTWFGIYSTNELYYSGAEHKNLREILYS
jgi:hypothetical protein